MKVYLASGAGGSYDWKAMKVYLSDSRGRGSEDLKAMNHRPQRRPLRMLLSYHYYKDEDLDALLAHFPGVELDVFADSGAYSAHTSGQPVVEEAYVEWVLRWQHLLTVACGPDVIGDPVATHAATERMLGRVTGIPVLPTFHVGEDWAWLTRARVLADYVALGGMVPHARERKLLGAWCRKAFGLLPEGTRVHGFGATTWNLLLEFPWYSVDSSSWTAGFRFASLMLFDAERGRMVTLDMRDRREVLRHAPLLAQYRLRPPQVLASDYDRDMLCGAVVESWQRAEEWLSRRAAAKRVYLSVGISKPGAGGHVARGAKVYLSCGAEGGAPNRPENLARGTRVYLTAGGETGSNASVRDGAHALDEEKEGA